MPIALVAHISGNSGGTGGFTTSGIDTTGATALVANLCCYGPSGAPALTDSKGNVWHPTSADDNGIVRHILYYCVNPIVGSGHTFSIANVNYSSIEVAAFSGVTGAAPLDSYIVAQGGGGGSLQAGSITPANNNSVIVAGVGFSANGTVSSIDSSFTITDNQAAVSGQCEGGALAYLVQTTAGAVNPQWTFGGALTAHATNIVLIAGSASPPVAPALVAHTAFQFSSTTTSPGIDTTGATLLVVNQTAFNTLGTITDSYGNTWTALTQRNGNGGVLERLYYAENPTVGTGHTFTVTGGNAGTLEVAAFSGTNTSSTFDTQNGAISGSQVNAFQAGSATPAGNNSLVILGIAIQNSASGSSLYGIDQPFAISDTSDPDGSHIGGSLACYVQPVAAAINPWWFLKYTADLAASIAVFKAPAATHFAYRASGEATFEGAAITGKAHSYAYRASGLMTFEGFRSAHRNEYRGSGPLVFAGAAVTRMTMPQFLHYAGSGEILFGGAAITSIGLGSVPRRGKTAATVTQAGSAAAKVTGGKK
jgi:hypothetical protein